MRAVYKKLTGLLVAVLMLGASVVPAFGAEARPVLVVSVAGIDSLLADIGYVTETAGVGDFGRMAAMMSQPYTQGLDRTKPIGIVVTTDGAGLTPLGFVPVKDLNALLQVIPPQLGQARPAVDGVLEIEGPQPLFIRQLDGWALVGQSAETVKNSTPAPEQQLGGLVQQYDIAIRAHVSNIPQMYREMALSQMKIGVQSQLDAQAGQDQLADELRGKLVENQIKQWETLLNEIDQITIGLNIDPSARNAYVDMSMTALAGTKTAKQFAMLNNAKSAFAGVLRPDAAVTLGIAGQFPQEEIDQTVTMLALVREAAKRQLEDNADLPNAQALAAAKELVDALFGVATSTIKSGRIDGAASVNLAPRATNGVVALYVADGAQVETALKKLVDLANQDANVPKINFNADQHAGVRFHTMNIDLPKRDDVRQVFGDRLELVVGIGQANVYFAAGQNSLTELKGAIDRSEAAGETSVAPFQLKVALGPILRFASLVEDNPTVAALADTLQNSGGKDHILITGKPLSQQGVTYRFELQEGVFRAIGQARGTETVGANAGF